MSNDVWAQAGEDYCKNLIATLKAKKEARENYLSLKEKMTQLLKLLGGFFTNLADLAGAELLSAISELSSNIVSSVAQAASGATSAILERIMSSILEILLSGPEVLLALIGLPLKEATVSANREAGYLTSANDNLTRATEILSKWLSGFGGEKYYTKMITSLPYIEAAIIDMAEMIKNLQTTEDKSAYFSDTVFDSIVANLEQAIILSEPESAILEYTGVSQAGEIAKQQFITSKTLELRDGWYNPKRDLIDATRKKAIAGIRSQYAVDIPLMGDLESGTFTGSGEFQPLQAAISLVDSAWESAIDTLDTEFTVRKQGIIVDAASKQNEVMLEVAINAGADTKLAEFNNDIAKLKTYLVGMLSDIKDAFKYYSLSQVYTNSTYFAIDKVKQWIRWFIDMAKDVGGGAADVATEAVIISKIAAESARDSFTEDVARYNEDKISASKMSLDLILGNAELKISEAVMNGTITESLISIINLDEYLGDEAKRFNEFRSRIADIPDFDGKKGIWAVDLADSTSILANPYLDLIRGIGNLILSAPKKMSSSKASDNDDLRRLISQTNRDFTDLLRHNNVVRSTLNSYAPYSSGKTTAIKKLLDRLGFSYLKYAFLALSLTDFVKGLTEGLYSFSDRAVDCLLTNHIDTLPPNERREFETTLEDQKNSIATLGNIVDDLAATERMKDYKAFINEVKALFAFDYADTGFGVDQGSGIAQGTDPVGHREAYEGKKDETPEEKKLPKAYLT